MSVEKDWSILINWFEIGRFTFQLVFCCYLSRGQCKGKYPTGKATYRIKLYCWFFIYVVVALLVVNLYLLLNPEYFPKRYSDQFITLINTYLAFFDSSFFGIFKKHWLILQVVTIVYLIHVFEKPWFSHMVPTHDGKSVMADWITYLVVWYLWLAQIIPFLSNCLWQPHHYSSPTFFIRSLV